MLPVVFSFWTFGELYGKSNDTRATYQSDAMKFHVNQMSFKFYNVQTKSYNNNKNKVCKASKQINRLTNGRTRQIARQINGHIYNCICFYGAAWPGPVWHGMECHHEEADGKLGVQEERNLLAKLEEY